MKIIEDKSGDGLCVEPENRHWALDPVDGMFELKDKYEPRKSLGKLLAEGFILVGYPKVHIVRDEYED